ncbi:hypothetical protein C5167_005936 [Papaver somniferum]|uniref:NAC domain-containing protein n=1 Tax=Papaver somniferum TaxID=3469 RepID=A0A4Y7JFU8_PAPSO|nr:putative NAC domain-containing protein 94 isoform X1 [Papaver somniferum]XP_026379347.1 putative NAC domain-containing protein 94 isoform X1 [Papaver somniferum]RZC58629.1 hypothetical protein C5167_005936 [Papaver somniferum]
MDDKYDSDKLDDIMLPGFRFHPTDEELVGFYLKRKIQQRPLSIELIKQLDIYKYDPWDLPKELSTTGEKEWYFYCPRDRKYRNSARPNRVTGAGFWKATGTDRPIYSSEGTKCIGLKKSLVFYTGRAAKGVKTDWMMHEFRLPSLTNPATPKRFTDKTLPVNDSWAICRIFKKTNSMAQRALSHSWVSPIPELNGSQIPNKNTNYTHFRKESMSCISEAGSTIQFSCNNNDLQQCSPTSFSPINIPSYKPDINPTMCKQSQHPTFNGDLSSNFMFSSLDMAGNAKYTADIASMLLNFPPALLGDTDDCPDDINFSGTQQEYGGFSSMLPQEMQGNISFGEDEEAWLRRTTNTLSANDQWGTVRSVDFPFNLPISNLTWDSLPCPSDISTSYSTNKCYT